MKRILKIITTALLIWLLILDLKTSRNYRGNPAFETLKAECVLSGGEKVRLYEGNGGATTAYWYTVTFETTSVSEQQVIFSYAYPTIESLSCEDQQIQIDPIGGKQTFTIDDLYAPENDE